MDAYMKGEMMMMVDQMVGAANKSVCRASTNLDFNALPGSWVPYEEFNKYMATLETKAGKIGPQVAGRQVGTAVAKNSPIGSGLEETFYGITAASKENNRGADCGEFIVEEFSNGFLRLSFTGNMNERFYLGLFEGILRVFKKIITKAEITETFEKNGKSVFEISWKDGLAG